MKTKSFPMSLFAGCLIIAACSVMTKPAIASVLVDPMDSLGSWGAGGGGNANPIALTVDTVIKTEGTGSLDLTANFLASGSAYADLYLSLPSAMDFSANTFNVAFQTTDAEVYVLWRLGTVSGPVYEATYIPTMANSWVTISFTASDFTANVANLQDVNLIQFRIIGDALDSYPTNVSSHFDNLQIVPEPHSMALAALGGVAVLTIRRTRRTAA